MDAVIADGKKTISSPATGGAYLTYDIYFGGSYQESWSEDYTLSIVYENRSAVQAAFIDGRWQAVGGDEMIRHWLTSEDCPPLMRSYFQAAASVYAAARDCVSRGLSLRNLWECWRADDNPLAAPELMRLLMDDCGFSLQDAFQLVAICCRNLVAAGVDVEQVYALQPRTAHVISILRSCAVNSIAVTHDSWNREYRSPLGAVPEETELTLSVRVLSGRAERSTLLLYGDELRQGYPMQRQGDRYSVTFTAPAKAAALWYCFRIETADSAHWLCPGPEGHLGRLYGGEAEGFRLTVYRRDFETPAWFRRSVLYQIFPDRFAFSSDGTAEKGIAYHRALGQTPELHGSRDEPVRWQPRPFEKDYSPDDFYGGTLKGITEKLPYLKELGVSCLYLNPIVEARSNHRYDTSDYLKVDPILGETEDLEELCRKGRELGIRVILDGVFSHTGADSVYFNRYGSYPGEGACQSRESPYFSWYDFRRYPEAYRCWWGFQDLPEVDERNPSWQDFVVTGENSVVKTWLRRGASGWRLDVADELPDEVLSLIRASARAEKSDALILGEVWEDAVIKESYGGRRNYALGYSLDTVMNYPLRTAVLDFMHRRIDAYGLRDFLSAQQMNYPLPMYYSLMNLLGSHDVDRLRSALATDTVIRNLRREEQMNLQFGEEALERAVTLEKLCATIQFALPGVPSIYYGDEQGMCGVCDPFNRLPFREDRQDLHDCYAALAAQRNAAPALSTGKARFLAASGDVLLILRWIEGGKDVFGQDAEDGAWLAVINRADRELSYTADCSAAGKGTVTGQIGALTAEIRNLSSGSE